MLTAAAVKSRSPPSESSLDISSSLHSLAVTAPFSGQVGKATIA